MVGSMALTTVADEQRSWEIQYSRLFAYLPPPTSHPSSITPIAKGRCKATWLSSATPTAILSLSADPPRSDFILTISFHGIILEQHYASKLRFSWPQLSCMSNVPQQCSRVVLVSYKDGASVVGLSNKQLFEDFMASIRSSQSEATDMLGEVVLTGASQIPNMTPLPYPPKSGQDITASHSSEGYVHEISECYIPEISEVYVPPVLPPRFTSFVTNCSEMAHGQAPAASIPTASEVDLKSLIAVLVLVCQAKTPGCWNNYIVDHPSL
ncbi:hypothetical protein V2J09_003978 [Rumex salicifolius]